MFCLNEILALKKSYISGNSAICHDSRETRGHKIFLRVLISLPIISSKLNINIYKHKLVIRTFHILQIAVDSSN